MTEKKFQYVQHVIREMKIKYTFILCLNPSTFGEKKDADMDMGK